MKTTLEISDAVFRRAKARAAASGLPLRQFVTDAVEQKLRQGSRDSDRPWLKLAGKLSHLKGETARIKKRITDEFEKVEPEDRL